MKRNVLGVLGMLAVVLLVYFVLARKPAEQLPAPASPPPPVQETASSPRQPDRTPRPPVADVKTATTWIRNRAEFEAALNALGLRGPQLVDALREWRIARGYVAADPLVDDRDSASPIASFEAMDTATLRATADSGDMLALQVLATRTLPPDAMGAFDLFVQAAERGSTAAMFQVARMLNDFSHLSPADRQANPKVDRKLLAIQGGNPDQDFRELALAWGIAAIRQDGPAVADATEVEWLELAAGALNPERRTAACGRSLAVFAQIGAARRTGSERGLPAVFVAPTALYDRLPCGDGPAPVMPPPQAASCKRQPVSGQLGRALDLWICTPD